MGINCERVMIARLRTTGRECDSRGARTVRGAGLRSALDRFAGKRLIRIDKIDNDSTKASGGVSG